MSYPYDVGGGIYVYAGPEPRPFDTTGPISSNPNPIFSIKYILPPICTKCSRYASCACGLVATLEDCEANLRIIPEKRRVIKVKKRKRD